MESSNRAFSNLLTQQEPCCTCGSAARYRINVPRWWDIPQSCDVCATCFAQQWQDRTDVRWQIIDQWPAQQESGEPSLPTWPHTYLGDRADHQFVLSHTNGGVWCRLVDAVPHPWQRYCLEAEWPFAKHLFEVTWSQDDAAE